MSFIQRLSVEVTTIADGSQTAYSPVITGKLSQIRYVKDAIAPFADGVGFTITSEATGETLWAEAAVNASATRAPRQASHTTAGVAAGAGILEPIALANDRAKIVIASGGNAKIGTFHFLVD